MTPLSRHANQHPEPLADPIAVLRHIVAAARAVAHADGAAILLYDPENALFVPTTPSVALGLDERWLQRQGLEAAQTLALRAVTARAVVEILDTADVSALDLPLLAGGRRPGGACAAPLLDGATVVGVLELYSAAARTSPVDQAMLRSFVELASVAIAAARAHQRERTLRARLEDLDDAINALAVEYAPDRVLQRIIEIATGVAGARYGALGVVGDDGYLTDFITTGISSEERARIGALPRGDGLLGTLIRRGQSLRVRDMGRDPRQVGFPPHHPPMTSLLGVPIRVRDAVVGDLYLTDKIGAPAFDDDDQRLVELLAAHAGTAIENARLHAQEQEARHTLQRALEAMRDSEERFSTAFHANPTPSGITRVADGTFIDVNEAFLDLTGYRHAELLGRTVRDIALYAPPSGREDLMAMLQAQGRVRATEVRVRLKSGAFRDALVSLERITLRGDPYLLSTLTDITARKRAERNLRLLAETGIALGGSLDEQAILSAIAHLVVPVLADWCSVVLVEDGATLHRLAVAPTDPARDEVVQTLDRRYPLRPDASSGVPRVIQTGQPDLVPDVTDAALVALAEDGANLAVLRSLGLVSYMIVPLSDRGQTLGAITLGAAASGRRYGLEDLTLAEDVARRAALAVVNARLHAQVRALTVRNERERIGRDLHDGIIQDIYAATLQLENVAEDVPDPAIQERVLGVSDHLAGVIRDVRTYIGDLRVPRLEGRTLSDGLGALATEVSGQGGLEVSFALEGTPYRLPDTVANTLLQTTRETLSNVIRHAHATQASVRLAYAPQEITLTLADNGRGFDPDALRGEEHHGLRNLRTRLADIGGTIRLASAPGAGTTIVACAPALPEAPAAP